MTLINVSWYFWPFSGGEVEEAETATVHINVTVQLQGMKRTSEHLMKERLTIMLFDAL